MSHGLLRSLHDGSEHVDFTRQRSRILQEEAGTREGAPSLLAVIISVIMFLIFFISYWTKRRKNVTRILILIKIRILCGILKKICLPMVDIAYLLLSKLFGSKVSFSLHIADLYLQYICVETKTFWVKPGLGS